MIVDVVRLGGGRGFPAAYVKHAAGVLLRALEQDRSELTVALVGDAEMRPLNRKYRKKNKTTDVLSFIADETFPTGTVLLGDVVISVEQARRQAAERRKTLKSEMTVLLIHGILHLLGYDHERSERQAKIMAKLECELLSHLCERGLLKV